MSLVIKNLQNRLITKSVFFNFRSGLGLIYRKRNQNRMIAVKEPCPRPINNRDF